MRLRVTLTMATPILGSHIPTLRSLIEYGCCIREGDDGMVTADRILPVGERFEPVGPRRGFGRVAVAAKITSEYSTLDPEMVTDALGKSNVKTIKGRSLVVEPILNPYSWFNYDQVTAVGEGDPREVRKVLHRIDAIGVRRNVGWGWIAEREVEEC